MSPIRLSHMSYSVSTILLLCALDTWYYGSIVVTPLNFIFTNLSSVSLFYGSSAWHYYLSQGIPILCGTMTPFALHEIFLAIRSKACPVVKRMTGLIAWTILIYSLAGHKEWRFLHPLLPIFHVLSAVSLVDHLRVFDRVVPARRDSKFQPGLFPRMRIKYWLILALNIPPLLYLMLFHSRAQIDVTHFFRSLEAKDVRSIGFLMPCHSTPWQAYIHKSHLAEPGRFWALGCEPPIG
jgi:GPI mannosyltransferase 3